VPQKATIISENVWISLNTERKKKRKRLRGLKKNWDRMGVDSWGRTSIRVKEIRRRGRVNDERKKEGGIPASGDKSN